MQRGKPNDILSSNSKPQYIRLLSGSRHASIINDTLSVSNLDDPCNQSNLYFQTFLKKQWKTKSNHQCINADAITMHKDLKNACIQKTCFQQVHLIFTK